MGKTIRQEYITGEKGVAEFNSYCANHSPFLIFREEQKHDFGIDGEIELTFNNANKQIEASGKIMKIQLKSTFTGSYIVHETESDFEFVAKTNDIEYWKEHDLPVVLVVFFEKTGQLYAQKVDKLLILKGNIKSHKIKFNKGIHSLNGQNRTFSEIVDQEFVLRIEYATKERLFSNLMPISFPNLIFRHKSKFKQAKRIFDIVNEEGIDFPHFILVGEYFYTFSDCSIISEKIRSKILKTSVEKLKTEQLVSDNDSRRILIRLLNKYFKNYFYHKGLTFHNDLGIYYFKKNIDDPIETRERENARTEVFRQVKYKGRANATIRTVVSKHTYYEESFFFKHLGFQLIYEWVEKEIFLILKPRYYYSEDGIEPLSNPKRITRLTNQIKMTERNQHVLNHLFFFRNYFSPYPTWDIDYFNSTIKISKKLFFDVSFGIKGSKKRKNETSDTQLKLDI